MQPSMIDVFRAVAAAVPDRDCIVHRSVRRTYSDVLDRTERLGRLLAAHGLGVRRERDGLAAHESGQDHLALYLHNGPEYLEGFWGALTARVAPVNVNYRYTAAELRYLLDDSRPGAIVYHATFAPVLAEALADLPVTPLLLQVADSSGLPLLPGALDYEKALADAPAEVPLPDVRADDLVILYTGGTTGKPKGTLWRNGDMLHNLTGTLCAPGTAPADVAVAVTAAPEPVRSLGSAPFMHATGTWGALRTITNGGLVAVPDSAHRLDPADVCNLIERERLNVISLVGEAFCRPVADELERHPHDLSAVRTVLMGGVATHPRTKLRLLAHMPDAVLSESVGSSETMAVLNRQDRAAGANVEGGVFSLLPRACAVDLTGGRLLVAGDPDIGLLAAREPLPLGYLGDPDKTAETFRTVDGTRLAVPGDLVRLRPDGRVQLLGREATTINTGGEKVHAEEVERVLLAHPAVMDVLVVGRPSERWGQEVVALVRLVAGPDGADSPDDEALRAHAGRELARYKLPKAFVRVPGIRRNPMGKPDYTWARRLAAQAAGPRAASHTERQN